jgi:hypothetical protein
MRRATIPILMAFAILAPPETARAAGLAIEGMYGLVRPPDANFRAAIAGAANDRDLSESSLQIAGGSLLLDLDGLEVGAIVDQTFGDGVTQTAVGALAGLRVGDKLRLDLLGEVGGHRFGDIRDDPSVVTSSSTDEWLFYVGLRPGLAYRVDLLPGVGFLVGAWGFVRWDVTDKNVPVTVSGATGLAPGDGEVKLGGTSIGVTLRFGIEL